MGIHLATLFILQYLSEPELRPDRFSAKPFRCLVEATLIEVF